MSNRAMRAGAVLGLAATLLAGLGFVVVQQVVRHAADHPQIEMARTAVAKLNAGSSPASVMPAGRVDMALSPASFLMVLDSQQNVVASSATLGGGTAIPPSGVFDYVSGHGEDVITWQPAPGVRIAIAVDAFKGGFVVAGRSLRDTENTESDLVWWAVAAWAAALVLVGGVMFRLRS